MSAPPAPWRAPPTSDGLITYDELRLAARNPGTPGEALALDITPVGLHYVLTRFDIPLIDPATWRLTVDGLVDRPLALSLDDIRRLPATTLTVTMECSGNGRAGMTPRPLGIPWLGDAVGTAEWTGAQLRDVLAQAGLRPGIAELSFTGADYGIERGYATAFIRALTPQDALRPEVLLVYAMNGQSLPPQHGAPLRLIVPGWYGMASVKWLMRIRALDQPVQAYHQRIGYHFRAPGSQTAIPIRHMRPRALMVPPGHPDFFSRRRHVAAGRVRLQGRAWSGSGIAVTRVLVSAAGGADGSWRDAALGASVGPYAWRGWTFDWQAAPGTYELCCRATDALGVSQPLDPPFDAGGMGNNAIQRVAVVVD
ncbi:MAG: sulfite oxidase [Alphaproteobacteria bacterium]|nr:sulfite oxidase [Alphaproteobacteria bacterium]